MFIDSQVAAETLGTVKVQRVATTSGSGDFGFVAEVIHSYSRLGGVTATNLTAPGETDRKDHYVVEIL